MTLNNPLLDDCGNKNLRNIIPIRETVAGDAQLRSCVSKTKLTFGPNWIRSPEGIVSSRLSSSTELSDSIHSGSMSPSQTIHDWMFCGSLTTCRAAYVNTPSLHSRVSMSIWPSSYRIICTHCHHVTTTDIKQCFKYNDQQYLSATSHRVAADYVLGRVWLCVCPSVCNEFFSARYVKN